VTRGTVVVIPAFNEAASIERVAAGARRFADVVVVDDASTDATAAIVAGLGDGVALLRHARNTHIPGAITDGMRWALAQGYDRVVTMDAGDSHDPAMIPAFEARAADLVLSWRTAVTGAPLYRRALSRGGTWLMNRALAGSLLRAAPRFHDCTSGFRLYSRRAVEAVCAAPLTSRSFDFHLEALAIVYRRGWPIDEVPIGYRFANSSLRPRVVVHALRTAWRVWRGLGRPA
jgi:dolichol-phosphate mannosyltransferase